MNPLSAIPFVGAGIGSLLGIGQLIKSRQLEKQNKFTPASVSPLLAQNQAQAQNQALVGLPQQQYNNTLNQQNQNLASILASASRSGRNLQLGGLLRQSNQATQNLNVADAQARQQNRGIAMQQNQILANEQQRVRNWNVDQPYLRNMQRVAELRSAGGSNIFGALGMAANSALMMGQGGQTPSPTNAGITNFLSNQTVASTLPPLGYNVSTNGSYRPTSSFNTLAPLKYNTSTNGSYGLAPYNTLAPSRGSQVRLGNYGTNIKPSFY